MRLHRLRVTAFGPFGDTQHIDFDALSSAGIFLLHGATGAGKTSVLDAVCYALYGGVPGARQRRGQAWLRSDHATPGTPTEVVLELTAGGRRLEITRRPEQSRPKRRGSGTTVDKALTLLREHDAVSWQPLSRSHQEIGEEISQLLGMNREQFCQVALLPQGDFARFLRAGAEERGQLLGRLFDTRRFVAVERHLTELRGAALQRVRSADEQVLALAHRMEQAVADPDGTSPVALARLVDLSPGEPGLTDRVLEWAACAREVARLRGAATASARDLAQSSCQSARRRHAAESELAALQRDFNRARERSEALAAANVERAEVRDQLNRARAAEQVAPAIEFREAAGAQHQAALRREDAARAVLPAELAGASDEELTAREQLTRQQLGELRTADRAEERCTAIGVELTRLEAEVRADEEALAEAEEWLARWPALRADCQRRIDRAQEATARAEQLVGKLEPARGRQQAAAHRVELSEQASAIQHRLLAAREQATAAHERWLDLRERRLRGIAAELAQQLREREPCAVCGSTTHPAPAREDSAHVVKEVEEEALRDYRAAESHREAVQSEHAELRQREQTAASQAGTATLSELADLVAELEGELAQARQAACDAPAARENLERAESEHTARARVARDSGNRTASHRSRREALLVERVGLQREIDRLRGEATSVRAETERLGRLAQRLTDASTAAREAYASAERLKEADARLADATWRARFDTPEAAAQAALTEREQRTLQHKLDAWQDEERAVAAAFADQELRAAGDQPPADLAATEAELALAVERQRVADTEDAAAAARCQAVDRLSTEAHRLALRMAPLREGYERVAGLAGLAAGTSADNERKMRLESYVLAARLEQVAAAASERLTSMSDGRYTLVHSDERVARGARSGLGLHVVDAWTGRERDTGTLSGGETFFASLALALGLSDVVSEEAGGARLDTLFIDEGFGSLDEQTLDEVLEVLDSLRERERCVGIVSHVADLRLRIPAQLEVLKRREGSQVRHRGV